MTVERTGRVRNVPVLDLFLQSVNASFAVTPATLRGVARLVGLGHDAPAAPPAPAPSTFPPSGSPDQQASRPPPPVFGGPRGMVGGPGGEQGFSLNLSYTLSRTRPPATAPTVLAVTPQNREQLNATLSFQPTDKWQANWATSYDLVTHEFSEHNVRLERDLHRWRATFSFVKSSNGNFAFSFSVSLLDEPDIKFDYEQQTVP